MYNNKRKSESEYLKEKFNYLPHEELIMYSELTEFLKYYSVNYYISNMAELLNGEKKTSPNKYMFAFLEKNHVEFKQKISIM
jgi:uncharacterized protein